MSREKSLFQRARDSQESDREKEDCAAVVNDKNIYERSIEGNVSDIKQNNLFLSRVIEKVRSDVALSSSSRDSAQNGEDVLS